MMTKTLYERRFMWAVQALALPAEQQLSSFPSFAEVADELALEHEETQAGFLTSSGTDLTSDQKRAIEALDEKLEMMSGEENATAFWTVEALGRRPEWEQVRSLARNVLSVMGWPASVPPLDRGAMYVESPKADR